MNQSVYAVYDKKSSTYGRPFVDYNNAHAIRGMTEIVMGDHESMIRKYPEDFDLYRIGEYCASTGVIVTVEKEWLCNGGQLQVDELRRQKVREDAVSRSKATLTRKAVEDTIQALEDQNSGLYHAQDGSKHIKK